MKNAKKCKGLGRGLDSFFSDVVPTPSDGPQGLAPDVVFQCPIDQLVSGKYQPRTSIDSDSLEALATSIRAHGLMQPIVVRAIGDDRYEIIAGERRWRACRLVGWKIIPAILRDVPDVIALPLAIIENIQRESLSPIDEARAIKRLLDEFGLTHQQVSDSIGRSRTAVTNLLRLLVLHPDVLSLVQDDCLDVGHARALLTVPFDDQLAAARHVIDKNLSVRQTEQFVRASHAKKEKKLVPVSSSQENGDADARRLQEKIADVLCAPVFLSRAPNGSFRLSIQYDCLDQLDDFLNRLGVISD